MIGGSINTNISVYVDLFIKILSSILSRLVIEERNVTVLNEITLHDY